MTTKTCTNGHIMTGIGFDECPECDAHWNTTPQSVEEIIEEFRVNHDGVWCLMHCTDEDNKPTVDGISVWLRTTLTTTRQQAFEEGVKAGREKTLSAVIEQLDKQKTEENEHAEKRCCIRTAKNAIACMYARLQALNTK